MSQPVSRWRDLLQWVNPLSYFGNRTASLPAVASATGAQPASALKKGATAYPKTTIAERLSYVTVIISCHGADSDKLVTLPRNVSVRKLSLSGKCGVLMWSRVARHQGQAKEPIEIIIFDEFSKFRDSWIERHPSGGSVERLNHAQMLDEFSLYLKGSGLPQGLQDIYHLAKTQKLPRNIAPTIDDWISYTNADIEHDYSFYGDGKTQQDRDRNCASFGIWLVDSSDPSFTAKDRASSKLKSLEDIMKSKNIYQDVKDQYEERVNAGEKRLRITLSNLVSILSERYNVKNVNIIDTSCRYLPEKTAFADVLPEDRAFECLSPSSFVSLITAADKTSKHNRGGGKICNTMRKNKHRNKNKNKGSLNCRSRARFITRRHRRSRTSGSRRH
jgi:hypothetical protein